MYVTIHPVFISVYSSKPSDTPGLRYIGFYYSRKTPGEFTIYPDFTSRSMDKGVWFDEIFGKLIRQADQHNDEQSALCAYDRLVELGYLQLPEE